jgi:hypothetical protein
MTDDLYRAFLASDDTLRVYRRENLLFSSQKEQLLPLMEYLAAESAVKGPVAIYDKVMGNAAALLSIKAHAREVYSPLGSELAMKTLQKHGIRHHLDKVVPYILRDDGRGMCPMEQLSIGKEPEELYRELKARLASRPGQS